MTVSKQLCDLPTLQHGYHICTSDVLMPHSSAPCPHALDVCQLLLLFFVPGETSFNCTIRSDTALECDSPQSIATTYSICPIILARYCCPEFTSSTYTVPFHPIYLLDEYLISSLRLTASKVGKLESPPLISGRSCEYITKRLFTREECSSSTTAATRSCYIDKCSACQTGHCSMLVKSISDLNMDS